MQKKKFNSRLTLLAVRNLLIVLASLFAAVMLAEGILNLQLLGVPEADNDRVVRMSYEKTPVPALLTTEENRLYAEQLFANPADYARFIETGSASADKYPYISDLPVTAPCDENTVRIVVIGDSFTWGEACLNRNELFWRQAERILREKGYNVRFSAVAAEGASAYEELRWLTDGVYEDLSPDLVIFGYLFNDAMPAGNGIGDLPERLVIPSLTWLQNLAPRFAQKVYSYVDAKTLYNKKFGDRYHRSYIAVLDDELAPYYTEHFIRPLDSFCKANDLPAIVLTLPNEPKSLLLKSLYAPLTELYRDTSVRCLDSCSAFARRYGGAKHKDNITVNPQNLHPGSAAHRFYAEYICETLLKDYRELLGEPQNTDLNSRLIAVNDRMPGEIGLKTVYQREDAASYTFTYPDITAPHSLYDVPIEPYCLTWPIGTDYIKLSFENPVRLSDVRIEGDAAAGTRLWYTALNEKLGYDDHSVFPVSAAAPGEFRFPDQDARVTSLCIHADSPGELTVTINGKEQG